MCKLQKSLYGLKQSGRNWNNMLHQYLLDEQFEQPPVDACVYTRIKEESKVTIIVWVDGIIIILIINLYFRLAVHTQHKLTSM